MWADASQNGWTVVPNREVTQRTKVIPWTVKEGAGAAELLLCWESAINVAEEERTILTQLSEIRNERSEIRERSERNWKSEIRNQKSKTKNISDVISRVFFLIAGNCTLGHSLSQLLIRVIDDL
jgi:hypothetical protein